MKRPIWVERATVLIGHGESLAAHDGVGGLRDVGLLDSALVRPLNLHAYDPDADAAALAAAYAFGIVRNHPFVDGNKRTAFLTAALARAACCPRSSPMAKCWTTASWASPPPRMSSPSS